MTTRDKLLQDIAAAGLESAPGRLSPNAIYLGEPCDVRRLPGFDAGHRNLSGRERQQVAGDAEHDAVLIDPDLLLLVVLRNLNLFFVGGHELLLG